MGLGRFLRLPDRTQAHMLQVDNKAAAEPSKVMSIDSFNPIELKVLNCLFPLVIVNE